MTPNQTMHDILHEAWLRQLRYEPPTHTWNGPDLTGFSYKAAWLARKPRRFIHSKAEADEQQHTIP